MPASRFVLLTCEKLSVSHWFGVY